MVIFADHTSTAHLKSNRLRLWFSTFSYLLMRQVRHVVMVGKRLAEAKVGTIKLKLMEIPCRSPSACGGCM